MVAARTGEDEFVFLSNLLKTKEKAEKKRLRPNEPPKHRYASVGVGFVRAFR
jgi:hypothetical protein